jgi:hypothetical protein
MNDRTVVTTAVVCVATFITFNPKWPYPGFVVAWLWGVGLGFLNRSLFSEHCPFYLWVVVVTLLVAGLSLVPG